MRILFPYAPDLPQERMGPARAALVTLEQQDPAIRVDRVPCETPDAYETAFRTHYGAHAFIVWEHDLSPDPATVKTLWHCPEPYCAQAYVLHRDPIQLATTRATHKTLEEAFPPNHPQRQTMLWRIYDDLYATGPASVIVHRIQLVDGHQRWANESDQWADYVGFGLSKFPAQVPPPNWALGSWIDLDSRVTEYLAHLGIRWHLHWPAVPHHHYPD